MDLLARREHSLVELRRKLSRRFPDNHLIETELDKLAAENLQSDARYAESFVRQRATRGHGPRRLRQEMRDRGLADGEIETALGAVDIDWQGLAAEVYHRKFGAAPPADLKEKARRLRFMQYRGFDGDAIRDLQEL